MASEFVSSLMSKLSVKQKASLCSGYDFWRTQRLPINNVPSIMMTDGPHGLRKQESVEGRTGAGDSREATCFPPAATTANSFNVELMNAIGRAIGEEAVDQDVSIVLGPAINIKRSPLCGRNFEYVSEDPYLAGKMGAAWVKGVQSMGVGTSVKHFAANSQEKSRLINDSIVDERALREIYLSAFETVVKESRPWTVMGAYNRLNGTYCCENRRLLTDILRDEWGFDGVVMSDWGATNNRLDALAAGLDLEMPSSVGERDRLICEAIESGKLPVALLDRAVERLLTLIEKGMNKPAPTSSPYLNHRVLAKQAFEESAVLLKNDGLLPIKEGKSVAVLGAMAKQTRYQGGGSSHIHPTNVTDAISGFSEASGNFVYEPGYSLETEEVDEKLLAAAVDAAANKDVVVIFVGLPESFESESFDRTHMNLPKSHTRLIEEVVRKNSNVCVVVYAGSPIEMPWVSQVRSILMAYLPGQEGAGSIADILYGKVNPSGKLAESFPLKLTDTPTYLYFGENRQSLYCESVFVGYRYYDAANMPVLFPFGHGLSYSSYSYGDISLTSSEIKEGDPLTVSINITNISEVDGKEAVQLYIAPPKSKIYKPVRQLAAFKKVFIQRGETRTVEFELDKRAFAYYNTQIGDWHVESGTYKIEIGASSRDIRAVREITVTSSRPEVEVPDYTAKAPQYYNLDVQTKIFDKKQFEEVYGKPIEDEKAPGKGEFTLNSALEDLRNGNLKSKLFYRSIMHGIKKKNKKETQEHLRRMNIVMTREMPLRTVASFSMGKITIEQMDALVMMFNGHFFKGLMRWRKAKKRKKDLSFL
ncbi:MAG: glycoside hydrolase family 3 C-terminal domain-containing protein [Saccharofermentanaceae bacterium]|nr:glycoside hydrolase family 3 C-terminal domain-containing protein [Saccharofermentanaceae bacterium]